MTRFPRTVVLLVLATTCLTAGRADAVPDVSGRWWLDGALNTFSQNGSALEVSGGLTFTGSIDESGTFQVTHVHSTSPPCGAILAGRVLENGGLLAASYATYCGGGPSSSAITGRRCTCDDGNATPGDGCDASCQVEPCFSCAGAPSVCTPLGEGAACDDRAACTVGETCSGGACRGGTRELACTDVTGTWDTLTESFGSPIAEVYEATQENEILMFSGYVGYFDPFTREVSLYRGGDYSFGADEACLGSLHGTVTADGNELSGTMRPSAAGGMSCAPLFFEMTGTRRLTCGDGVVDRNETCDDGNTAPGDGCSELCRLEPCFRCDAENGCVAAPRDGCRASTAPAKGKLVIKRGTTSAQDKVQWTWQRGAETSLAALGDPLATNDYTLCAYDGSGPTPALAFRATAPAGGTCGTRPCWKSRGPIGFGYSDAELSPDGLQKLTLSSGAAGKAKAIVSGKGALLSGRPFGLTSPVPLPLTVQLQGANGVCFEARYEAAGVTRNDARGFTGKGAP